MNDCDYVLGVLAKPDGAIAVFKKVDVNTYHYDNTVLVPSTPSHYIQPKRLSKFLSDLLPNAADISAVMVKPESRDTDNKKTLLRVGYNVSTIKAVLDLLNITVEWVKNAATWQNYFNIDQNNPKQSALDKATQLLPNTSIESTEQAEAILIGVYGIETVIKKSVRS